MVLRRIIPALVFLSALAALPLNARGLDGPSLQRIPSLHGTTLAGATVNLPEALEGRGGILVIGFSRSSQEHARAWGKRLAQRYPADSGVVFYEMPVVADVPALLRGWVLGRIRQSVSAAGREHFLPVIDDEAGWKRAAGAGSASDTTVLLVDGHGGVHWRVHGPATDTAFGELERQVSLLDHSSGLPSHTTVVPCQRQLPSTSSPSARL